MTVSELDEAVKNDDEVWNLYKNGITFGLNQVEKEKSSKRCMIYKPHSVPELSALVAAIRPGFKSMLDTFINRNHFEYNIPSLDNLLKTEYIPESFLMYDEQILQILKAAGIPGPDAYACTKAIKKKKADKVASFKERFKSGFGKMLQEKEHASKEKADETVEEIWRIINDAASYMFCSAHSVSMAYDSLYCAWLKAHYPYELYVTMLKLYDEKKNTDKISAIISEMKRYKGIRLLPGRFGQDNRDWLVDKEHATISQSISSIRYISKEAAEVLYQIGLNDEAVMGTIYKPAVLKDSVKKDIAAIKKKLKQLKERYDKEAPSDLSKEELFRFTEEKEGIAQAGAEMEELLRNIELSPDSYETQAEEIDVIAKLDCFTNVLRAIQMNANVNTRMIEVLIGIGYFSRYGKTEKLMKVFNEFFEGKQKLTKTIKSFQERLEYMRNYEASLPDEDLPIGLRLQKEFDNIGLCLTAFPSAPSNLYFVESVDDKYSVRAKLYSVQRGTIGTIRITKKQQEIMPLKEGNLIVMEKYNMRQRCSYKDGKRIPIPGEKDCWVTNYSIIYENQLSAA